MVTTAGGVLTYALFPLALPGLVLLGIPALPLLPLVVVGAIAYAIFAVGRGGRRLARRAGGRSSRAVRPNSDRPAGSASATISPTLPSRRAV
jgi:hypothetical protein